MLFFLGHVKSKNIHVEKQYNIKIQYLKSSNNSGLDRIEEGNNSIVSYLFCFIHISKAQHFFAQKKDHEDALQMPDYSLFTQLIPPSFYCC